MNGHNCLACVGWYDVSAQGSPFGPAAYCEHPGCNWESHAATEQTQIEAFTVHHQFRHGDDS